MGQKLQEQSSMLHRAACTGQCISLSRAAAVRTKVWHSWQRAWNTPSKTVEKEAKISRTRVLCYARLVLELTQLREQTDASADRHLHELFAKTESVWW